MWPFHRKNKEVTQNKDAFPEALEVSPSARPLAECTWNESKDYLAWEENVAQIQRAPNIEDRKYLWVGMDDRQRPLLLHRDLLSEHFYTCGSAGSAKTTLALTPLVRQLIGHRDWRLRPDGS